MKKIIFTNESVKGQITDSINENLTDSELESIVFLYSHWASSFRLEINDLTKHIIDIKKGRNYIKEIKR